MLSKFSRRRDAGPRGECHVSQFGAGATDDRRGILSTDTETAGKGRVAPDVDGARASGLPLLHFSGNPPPDTNCIYIIKNRFSRKRF